jgi:hypothetical protein
MWPFRRHKPLPKKSDVLATQVRVKSITRPLTKRNSSPPPTLAGQVPVEAALQRLLGTDSWSETRRVLDYEASALLTDEAQALLHRYVHEVRESGAPEAVNIAMYLEAHRLLLDRARTVGIDRAWDEFLAIRPIPEKDADSGDAPTEAQATMIALRDLLGTDSWTETFEQLLRHQDRLLSDSADQLITALIQLAMQETSPEAMESVRYLELHRALLRDARTLGTERAWSNFEVARAEMERERDPQRTMPPVNRGASLNPAAISEALRTLLTTPSWNETRRVLEQQQTLLLNDLCDQFISQLITAAGRDPDPRAARSALFLELHRRLLRRARSEGIPSAWEAFRRDLAQIQDDGEKRPSALHGGNADLAAVHRAVRE